MKGTFEIIKYNSSGGYRHIEIKVRPIESGAHAVKITWQSDHDYNRPDGSKWATWYARTIDLDIRMMADMKFANTVVKALTVKDQWDNEDYVETPADVIAALIAAKFEQVVYDRTSGSYQAPGEYYRADVPEWGYVWSPNHRTEAKARATVMEQIGSKSYARKWAEADFPMTYVTIAAPELDKLLDPQTL